MPPCGLLEGARAPAQRAGEGALLVAEQLALEEVGRDRAAVHHHERPRRARALAWWIASAACSLPVPVSPSSSTVASRAAARSSSAKQPRMATDVPTSEPKRVLLRQRQPVALRAEVEAQHHAPQPQQAAAAQHAFHHLHAVHDDAVEAVQILHLRPRGPIRTSQWKRDTVESSSAKSLSGCEPTEHVSAGIPTPARARALHHGEAEAAHRGRAPGAARACS